MVVFLFAIKKFLSCVKIQGRVIWGHFFCLLNCRNMFTSHNTDGKHYFLKVKKTNSRSVSNPYLRLRLKLIEDASSK
jgi:hypothetical protein